MVKTRSLPKPSKKSKIIRHRICSETRLNSWPRQLKCKDSDIGTAPNLEMCLLIRSVSFGQREQRWYSGHQEPIAAGFFDWSRDHDYHRLLFMFLTVSLKWRAVRKVEESRRTQNTHLRQECPQKAMSQRDQTVRFTEVAPAGSTLQRRPPGV